MNKRQTYKEELWRSFKFLLFSVSAGLIQMGSFAFLNEVVHLRYWGSYLIALILSIVWNFTLNRRFTFKSATNVPIAMLKVLGYYAVFTPLTTILGDYLVEGLLWNEYLVTFLNMFLNLVTEFLFQRFVVFRTTINTNVLAKKESDETSDSKPSN